MDATRSRTLAHAPFAIPTHASFILPTGPFGRSQRFRATLRTSSTLEHAATAHPHAHSIVARGPESASDAASPPVRIAKNEHNPSVPTNAPLSIAPGTGMGGGKRAADFFAAFATFISPLSSPSTNFGGGMSAAEVVFALSRAAARSDESSKAHHSIRYPRQSSQIGLVATRRTMESASGIKPYSETTRPFFTLLRPSFLVFALLHARLRCFVFSLFAIPSLYCPPWQTSPLCLSSLLSHFFSALSATLR